jgi:hypothetical protein
MAAAEDAMGRAKAQSQNIAMCANGVPNGIDVLQRFFIYGI